MSQHGRRRAASGPAVVDDEPVRRFGILTAETALVLGLVVLIALGSFLVHIAFPSHRDTETVIGDKKVKITTVGAGGVVPGPVQPRVIPVAVPTPVAATTPPKPLTPPKPIGGTATPTPTPTPTKGSGGGPIITPGGGGGGGGGGGTCTVVILCKPGQKKPTPTPTPAPGATQAPVPQQPAAQPPAQ
ncbi:MAG TPA: hypothetical protein VMZ00_13390 [Sporichthya sp.]|nr:hypothetical protein [Sporichthya sp.]